MIETDWEKVWEEFDIWLKNCCVKSWERQKNKIQQLVYEHTDNV